MCGPRILSIICLYPRKKRRSNKVDGRKSFACEQCGAVVVGLRPHVVRDARQDAWFCSPECGFNWVNMLPKLVRDLDSGHLLHRHEGSSGGSEAEPRSDGLGGSCDERWSADSDESDASDDADDSSGGSDFDCGAAAFSRRRVWSGSGRGSGGGDANVVLRW